ncbi:MAG: response regulator, partial [Deltaproteobacteria bacterium]|nr:response regulator [Deltaproteobacteria bacterium]
DRLADLDKAKSRFTANIHHELRTPLTLMLAPIEAMRSGDLGEVPASLDRTLRTMQSNGLRLLKLINNLLDLAKVESDQLSIRRVPLELGRLVQDIVDGALPMAERKGLELEAVGFEAVPTVNVDPDALEKVLVNLIGNSLKFTDAGRIAVRGSVVAAGEAIDGDDHLLDVAGVHLIVEDTGVGLPANQLARVFDRFAQVDGSTTRKHEGTGIGLSLVQELVALHGGQVWAASEGEGRGAQMHVLLPFGEADDDPEEEVMLAADGERALSAANSFKALASEVSMDLEESGAGRFAAVEHTVSRWEATRHGDEWLAELPDHPEGTPEVVIAEDNAEMRRLLAFLVGREFRVRPTRNGREALEAVRERAPALVLTDVMMPEMSGTELCRAIKEDDALSGVPVMLVTSKAEREMKIEGLELGADDYVTKPFHPRELLARTRSLVRIRTLQQELAERNEALEGTNQELAETLVELKEAEVHLVQAERLAAVGELSAGVAHEVNNPLNFARNSLAALRTYVDDLQGLAAWLGELDANDPATLRVQLIQLQRKKQELGLDEMAGELGELIGIVTEGLDRTAHLVSDLQTFASPGHGEHGLVDVGAGLRSTLQLLGHRLREAGVGAQLEIEAGLQAVPGDAGGLNQVFLNLLKNAIEALEGGGGTISVRARMAGRGELEVCVEDSGPGIEADVQARLFEPFFTTKGAGQGSGLGLAMCQRIVRGHGGRIELTSEPGKGTQVRVILPVAAGGGDDAGSG